MARGQTSKSFPVLTTGPLNDQTDNAPSLYFVTLWPQIAAHDGWRKLTRKRRMKTTRSNQAKMGSTPYLRLCSATLSFSLVACAAPQLGELRSFPPGDTASVQAPVECLYEKGSEHVSSYLGMSEPKYQTFINSARTDAWFRQPLTLVELQATARNTTEITRRQTSSAAALGQGDDLMQYLRSNPCGSLATPKN
jgi:hypothetical protein